MERMQIAVDLETQQALENTKALMKALADLRAEAAAASPPVEKLETGLVAGGRAASGAAQQFNTLNQNTLNVVNATQNLNTVVAVSTTNVTNNTSTINNNAAAARNAASATGSLSGQVQQLIAAYAGYQGLNKIMDEFLARKQQELDLAHELANVKLSSSEKLESVMTNLGLEGARGQQKARQLQQEVMRSAPVSEDQANTARIRLQFQPARPTHGGGDAVRDRTGQALARLHLSEQNANELVKTLSERGINTIEGLKTAGAKNSVLFRESASTNASAFLRGYVGSVLPEVAKGVDEDYAGASYAALLNQKANEQQAKQALIQSFTLAQGTNKKGLAYLGHQAAVLGVTKVGAVSDADLGDFISKGGSADADKVRHEQEAIEKARASLSDRDRVFKTSRRGHTAAQTREHRDAMAAEQTALKERELKLAKDREKLRDELTAQREAEAFLRGAAGPRGEGGDPHGSGGEERGGPEPVHRIDRRTDLAHGRHLPPRQRGHSKTGEGHLRQGEGCEGFGHRPREREIRGTRHRPEPAVIERERHPRAGGDRSGGGVCPASVRNGQEQSTARRRRPAAIRAADPDASFGDKAIDLFSNQNHRVANEFSETLAAEFAAMQSELSTSTDPSERRRHFGSFNDLYTQFTKEKAGVSNVVSTEWQQRSHIFATGLGAMKAQVEAERRQKREAAQWATPYTTGAAAALGGAIVPDFTPAADSGFGPRSDAGWGGGSSHPPVIINNHYHTQHVGNLWMGGGGDLDLPGRLEGIG